MESLWFILTLPSLVANQLELLKVSYILFRNDWFDLVFICFRVIFCKLLYLLISIKSEEFILFTFPLPLVFISKMVCLSKIQSESFSYSVVGRKSTLLRNCLCSFATLLPQRRIQFYTLAVSSQLYHSSQLLHFMCNPVRVPVGSS